MQTTKDKATQAHKLTFRRKFNPSIDLRPDGIKKGFIYVHQWQTGFQELVFDSPEEAKNYETKLNNPIN